MIRPISVIVLMVADAARVRGGDKLQVEQLTALRTALVRTVQRTQTMLVTVDGATSTSHRGLGIDVNIGNRTAGLAVLPQPTWPGRPMPSAPDGRGGGNGDFILRRRRCLSAPPPTAVSLPLPAFCAGIAVPPYGDCDAGVLDQQRHASVLSGGLSTAGAEEAVRVRLPRCS